MTSTTAPVVSNVDRRRVFSELSEETNRSVRHFSMTDLNNKSYMKPFNSVMTTEGSDYGHMAPTQQHDSHQTSESPDPTPTMDTIDVNTCVPSFLYHIGLSKYAAPLMRNSIVTCGQLVLTPMTLLSDVVPSATDRANILFALRDLYISLVSNAASASHATLPTAAPKPLSALEPSSVVPSLSLTSKTSSASPSLPSARTPSISEGLMNTMPSSRRVDAHVPRIVSRRQNDPYAFACIAPEDAHDFIPPRQVKTLSAAKQDLAFDRGQVDGTLPVGSNDTFSHSQPHALYSHQSARSDGMHSCPIQDESMPMVCRCLVRFKHRQSEYTSTFVVSPGQYVMVSGDRGQDLGLVLRVSTDIEKPLQENMSPQGTILRFAFQKEVDYVNRTLRAEEDNALELCATRVRGFGLHLRIHHAEYQYDKRKLTFYYESHTRVDFVALLKDLYREFGCRIWMEKMVTPSGTYTGMTA